MRFVNPDPSPPKEPENKPLKLLPPLVSVTVPEYPASALGGKVPVNWEAGRAPSRLLAVLAIMEYGAGRSCSRGSVAVNSVSPFVRTSSCSQSAGPVKTPSPKSSVTA